MKTTLISKSLLLTTLLSAAMLLGHLSTASAKTCYFVAQSGQTFTVSQYEQDDSGNFVTTSGGDKILNQVILLINQTMPGDPTTMTTSDASYDGSSWIYQLIGASNTILGYVGSASYQNPYDASQPNNAFVTHYLSGTLINYIPLTTGTATIRFTCNTPDSNNYAVWNCSVNVVEKIPVTPAASN